MTAHRLTNEIKMIDGLGPSNRLNKHLKMARSPFIFYRGTAQCFYSDIKSGVIEYPKIFDSVPVTNIIGDCHASNFGFLTEEGSHGDTVIFAPNDFDDACIGYAHWDLLRYLTSLHLVFDHCAGLYQGKYHIDDAPTHKPVIEQQQIHIAQHTFLSAYQSMCDAVVASPNSMNTAVDTMPEGKLGKLYVKAVSRAAGGSQFAEKSALAKAVYMKNEKLQFRPLKGKFIPLTSEDFNALHKEFSPYMDDVILDIIERENAGTGSVNMKRYYFLVGPAMPHDEHAFEQCHIIEVKQQRQAAPLYYFSGISPVNRLNPAHLTARCQRHMQRNADLLLDEVFWQDAHWLVRSRHHAKVGVDPEDIGMGNKAINGGFEYFAALCGKTLALAHCRGDRRSTRFAYAISKALVFESEGLIGAANTYAIQVIADHQAFVETLTGKE